MAECRQRIAQNPTLAREEAAIWSTFGGGAEALVCEARALEELGARTSAARILTEVATDRGNGLPAATRALLLREAGRLWLVTRQPRLTIKTLTSANELARADIETLSMLAEAHAQLGEWDNALQELTEGLELDPTRADLMTLRAAAKRKSGDPAGALTDSEAALRLLPAYMEAMFEKGAALALLDRMPEALDVWFKLIELDPDGPMADLARRNIQRLSGN